MREKEDSMICVPLNNSEDGGNIIEKVNTGDWWEQFGQGIMFFALDILILR